MSDESDDRDLPEWQVQVLRVQEGVVFITAESRDEALALAEDDLFQADWETVHTEVQNAELV